jgi:hypothetical protein
MACPPDNRSCMRLCFGMFPSTSRHDEVRPMKSIKFFSLILMCATSCLALVLPAIGVVSFPRQLTDHSAFQSMDQSPGLENSSILPGQPTFAVSASYPNSEGIPPSLGNSLLVPNAPVNKMGMGLWLLLVSTWFVSLFLWTVSPSPGVSKR